MVTTNRDYIPFTDFNGLYEKRDIYKFYILGGSTSLKWFRVMPICLLLFWTGIPHYSSKTSRKHIKKFVFLSTFL